MTNLSLPNPRKPNAHRHSRIFPHLYYLAIPSEDLDSSSPFIIIISPINPINPNNLNIPIKCLMSLLCLLKPNKPNRPIMPNNSPPIQNSKFKIKKSTPFPHHAPPLLHQCHFLSSASDKPKDSSFCPRTFSSPSADQDCLAPQHYPSAHHISTA